MVKRQTVSILMADALILHGYLISPPSTMDIDNVEPVFAKREFLAVVIAGFGNEYGLCFCRVVPVV